MKIMYLIAAAGVLTCASACNGGGTSSTGEDTTKVKADSASTDHTGTTMATDTLAMKVVMVDKSDSIFATKAAAGGLAEVAMGKLALAKGQDQRVKDFGAMMVKDHSAGND